MILTKSKTVNKYTIFASSRSKMLAIKPQMAYFRSAKSFFFQKT